eukprot:11190636-Alexandrium_andersonii.AAC.1
MCIRDSSRTLPKGSVRASKEDAGEVERRRPGARPSSPHRRATVRARGGRREVLTGCCLYPECALLRWAGG